MRRGPVLLLALIAVTAGCLATDGDPPSPTEPGGDGAAEDESGFPPAVNVSKEHSGAEPVVDVTSEGTILVQGQGFDEPPTFQDYAYPGDSTQNRVWRSTDGGETWTDVSPPGRGRNASCDAHLAVAPDDTVYAANCFIVGFPAPTEMPLYRSEDEGDTWTELTEPPFPPDVHRMWLVPKPGGVLHLAVESQYPDGGLYYLVSQDRGETWEGPIPVDEETLWGSELAVDAENGRLYAARLAHEADPEDEEDRINHTGPFYLRASSDGGRTWDRHRVAEIDERFATQAWQPLTLGPEGTLYLAWAETEDGRAVVHYTYSTDQGRTWQDPVALTQIDGTQTLVWAQARGPGQLALTYYQADEAGVPAEVNASWYAGYALVDDADTSRPNVTTERVTTWPVHDGAICTEGASCQQEREDRRLLEFTGVAFGPEGRAHTVFASTKWDGYNGFPVYATGSLDRG